MSTPTPDRPSGAHALWLPLTELEAHELKELATQQDLSEAALMRQALRLYQLSVVRHREGARCVWYDKDGVELDRPVGCPALD